LGQLIVSETLERVEALDGGTRFRRDRLSHLGACEVFVEDGGDTIVSHLVRDLGHGLRVGFGLGVKSRDAHLGQSIGVAQVAPCLVRDHDLLLGTSRERLREVTVELLALRRNLLVVRLVVVLVVRVNLLKRVGDVAQLDLCVLGRVPHVRIGDELAGLVSLVAHHLPQRDAVGCAHALRSISTGRGDDVIYPGLHTRTVIDQEVGGIDRLDILWGGLPIVRL